MGPIADPTIKFVQKSHHQIVPVDFPFARRRCSSAFILAPGEERIFSQNMTGCSKRSRFRMRRPRGDRAEPGAAEGIPSPFAAKDLVPSIYSSARTESQAHSPKKLPPERPRPIE